MVKHQPIFYVPDHLLTISILSAPFINLSENPVIASVNLRIQHAPKQGISFFRHHKIEQSLSYKNTVLSLLKNPLAPNVVNQIINLSKLAIDMQWMQYLSFNSP